MANIPTNEDNQSAQTGPVSPYATPASFGAAIGEGLQQLGMGVEHFARGGARAIRMYENSVAYTKKLDSARWASNAFEQEKRSFYEFASDPKNNTAENYAGLVDNFTHERMNQFTGDSAPSSEALTMFQENYKRFANDQYIKALGTSVNNKITNSINDTHDQIGNAIAGYRAAQQGPDGDGMGALTDSIAHIGANIEHNFRQFSPEIADKLQTNLISQSVLATMGDNPEAARAILDHTDRIDEHTRFTLNKEIEQAANSRNVAERESFDNIRKDLFTNIENGKDGTKIPISTYKLYYPDDQANAQKMKDDAYIDTWNKSNGILRNISPWNSNEQSKYLNGMQSKINGKMDQDVFDIVAKQTADSLKLQQRDPAGWLQKNNPYVSSLQQAAQNATQDNMPGALKNLNDAVKKFQGVPPPGTPDAEKKFYLGRPIEDSQHVLDTATANQEADRLNKSTPTEFIGQMNQLFQRYPGDEINAFNDLVTVPDHGRGLKQEYQFAWQNKDAPWLPTYLSSLANGGKLGTSEPVRKEIDKFVDADTTWGKFKSTMLGGNFVAGNQLQGFDQGIRNFSETLVAQGMNPKMAVSRATDLLINSTLGLPKVNGQPMMILKDRGPGQPARSDDDIKQLGWGLQQAIKYIDPRQIDHTPFLPLRIMGKDADKLPGMNALNYAINKNGFYKVGPDGQSASLYYKDFNGTPFPIKDKQGNQFVIHFKDLEDSMNQSHWPFIAQHTDPAHETPDQRKYREFFENYDASKGSVNPFDPDVMRSRTLSGRGTNWPSAPFIKEEKP